jgi:hypothetical protein
MKMTNIDVTGIAGTVSTVDEEIMRLLPTIATVVDFIPGGQIAGGILGNPLFMEVLQKLDNAAKLVAAGNPGAGAGVILGEVMNHLTPGQPNSPILSAPADLTSTAMSP